MGSNKELCQQKDYTKTHKTAALAACLPFPAAKQKTSKVRYLETKEVVKAAELSNYGIDFKCGKYITI